ncbi:MAG TPA: PQQ-binding-like beta-propeller repeat protein [Blastocatellia bacterium]|nr:PQQ-binding-like beta-propeller repeat protein [Blastocatellia bacterium]
MNRYRFGLKTALLICALLCLFGWEANLARAQKSSRPPVKRREVVNNQNNSALNQPQLVVQLGHSSPPRSIAFSSDGRFVLSASLDEIVLWEAATGREIRRFGSPNLSATVSAVFSPDGSSILAGGNGLSLFDASTGKEIWHQPAGVNSVAFSPNGQLVVTGGNENPGALRDSRTGEVIRSFEGDFPPFGDALFSPDGQRVVTYSTAGAYGQDGGLWARVWDVATGKELLRLQHPRAVESVAFSPDGSFALTGCWDGVARLWNLFSGKEVRRFNQGSPITKVDFSVRDNYILTTSAEDSPKGVINSVIIWDTLTGRKVRTIGGWETLGLPVARFSPDGRTILTATMGIGALDSDDKVVRLWDVFSGAEIREFNGYSAKIHAMAVSPDSRYIVTGGADQSLHLWDVDAGREVRRFTGHTDSIVSVAFSPDGSQIVSGSFDHTARVWDVETGRELFRLVHSNTVSANTVSSVAFSPDGQSILTGSWDRTARLWSTKTGKELHRFEHAGAVYSAAFSPDGHYVMTGSGSDSRVYGSPDKNPAVLWDAVSGGKVREFDSINPVYSIAFAPKDDLVLLGGDSGATLWNYVSGKEVHLYAEFSVNSVKFLPDGHQIEIYSRRGYTALYDTATNREIRPEEKSTRNFVSAFAPDDRFWISGGENGVIQVSRPDYGQEICRLVSFQDGSWAVVDKDGRFDANNLEYMRGLHWVLPDDPLRPLPVEIFMKDYYEPQLMPRLLAGEKMLPVKPLTQTNRVLPGVHIKEIKTEGSPNTVSVTVEVERGAGEFKFAGKQIQGSTGVYDLRLFRDGQLVAYAPNSETGNGAIKLDPTGKATITFSHLKLPRIRNEKEFEFSAYAFNVDRIKSETDKQIYTPKEILPPVQGRVYLITIGVNAYENLIWDLKFAANDARLTSNVLSRQLEKTGQYAEVVPIQLISDYRPTDGTVTEKTATKSNFKAVLDLLAGKSVSSEVVNNIPNAKLIKPAQPEDVIVISVSSHGYADHKGDFYFLMYDIGQSGGFAITEDLLRRSVSNEELSIWLRDVDAGEIILIADACQSAAAVASKDFKPGPMGSRGLGQLAYDKGMRILAASQADDVALENNKLRQGLLTYALVKDGIMGRQADYKPKDGRIDLVEWLGYGVMRVPTLVNEIKEGRVQRFTTGEQSGEEVTVFGNRGSLSGNKFQKPSLFDFSRSKRKITLVDYTRP